MSTLNEELTSLKLTVAELEKERSVALTHILKRVGAVWSYTSLNGDARLCTHPPLCCYLTSVLVLPRNTIIYGLFPLYTFLPRPHEEVRRRATLCCLMSDVQSPRSRACD